VKEKYYPPIAGTREFHCPHCNVYAKQFWAYLYCINNHTSRTFVSELSNFQEHLPSEWSVSKCQHCNNIVIWQNNSMIYPKTILVENPNDDLLEEIKKDYIEAANVFHDSPRAAAALLRLALQKLCCQLGEKGENINDDIKNLVKKGLNPLVQKSLDTLRITGNNAVHPGSINIEENPEIVLKLFELLNFIADKLLTEPKVISNFYDKLPEDSLKAIKKRDN